MTSWYDFAEALNAAGYSAPTYYNRGHGNSDPATDFDVGTNAPAAIAFTRSEGTTTVFFMGASMKGADDDARSYATTVVGDSEVLIYPTSRYGTHIFVPHPELADEIFSFVAENS